jgi:uncharacterized membrane protein
MNVKTATQLFFAATMIAIGLIGFISGGFAPIWRPVPESVPARDLLAHFSSFVALATGAGLLGRRTAAPAALALFACLLLWTLAFKARFIFIAPLEEGSYQSNGENVVLIAATWMLYADLAGKDAGRRIAAAAYGLALIAFGLSHFFYLGLTAPLVPKWLPGSVFWAYLTGVIYTVSGLGLLSGFATRSGALLAAVNITLITVLVWGPMVAAGRLTAMHWQETVVSWALMAASWLIAASFGGRRWIEYSTGSVRAAPATG